MLSKSQRLDEGQQGDFTLLITRCLLPVEAVDSKLFATEYPAKFFFRLVFERPTSFVFVLLYFSILSLLTFLVRIVVRLLQQT